jgi:hypothetical protein
MNNGHQFGYNPASPAPAYPQPQQHHMAPNMHNPLANGNFPAPVRTGSVSLPSVAGLPQRPAFGAPPVNAFQFQQMHQGQLTNPQNHNNVPQYRPQDLSPSTTTKPVTPVPSTQPPTEEGNAFSIDDLISTASKQADANAAVAEESKVQTPPAVPATQEPTPAKEEVVEDKGGKKEKEKPKSTRLVYSDNEISPEEKMALLPKYAFTPGQKSIMV